MNEFAHHGGEHEIVCMALEGKTLPYTLSVILTHSRSLFFFYIKPPHIPEESFSFVGRSAV